MVRSTFFQGNLKVKNAGIELDYTENQILEISKCADDIVYFCKHYCKVVSIDKGLVNFELYDYQVKLINHYHKNTRSIVLAPRQCGKTVTTAAYLLHYAMFNDHKEIAVLANKGRTAMAVMRKIRLIYENLPIWLKMGVVEYNKGSILFENGSRIFCDATTASGIRGDSLSLLYIDETAFIPSTLWYDFYTSVYPTIASSKSAKIIFSSTPKGMNHYYQLWTIANNKNSSFRPFTIKWNDPPGRDEAYKRKTIEELGGVGTGERKWDQEYETKFLGSDGTLINGDKLEKLIFKDPVETRHQNKFSIFEYPKDNKYIAFCDVSEGLEQDSSTIQVFKVDMKKNKYIQVARYKSNVIKTHDFPLVIYKIGEYYNNALVVVEANTYGREILTRLHYDLEYENLFFDDDFGLKMTKMTKRIGNSYLKDFIEYDKFEIIDGETITELSKYTRNTNGTYSADDGETDDLVTPIVLMSYFISKKDWVENWIDVSERKAGKLTCESRVEEDLIPTGFYYDGDEEFNMNPYSKEN